MESAIDNPDRPAIDDESERRRDLIVEVSQLDSPSRARAFSPDGRRVDWFLLIVALERKGYKHRSMCACTGTSKTSIGRWRNFECDPSHPSGEALIALWMSATGLPRDQVPMRKDAQLSAARVK